MKKLAGYIYNKLLLNNNIIQVRKKIGYIEGFVSIIINIVLSVAKVILGLISGSISLIADAAHSFSDALTSVVVIVGFKISAKPADLKHPFGHGRVEAISTLIIALVLFGVGLEFLISSLKRIINPTMILSNWTFIIIIMCTILIKEILASFSKHLARISKSKIIEADFWHHRSDSLSSLFVLLGIIGSIYGLAYLDGVAGCFVSLFIFYTAYTLTKETVNSLIGEPPSKELLETIHNIALSNKKVIGIHDVIVHYYGQKCLISLHIEIKDIFTAMEVHDISEEVENSIEAAIPLSEVTIHSDPLNTEHKDYDKISDFISNDIKTNKSILSFHDLRIAGSNKYGKIIFDLGFEKNVDEKDMKKIRNELIDKIKNKFSKEVIIKIEGAHKYQII